MSKEVKMPSGVLKRVPMKRSSPRNVKEFKVYMEFCENFYICNFGIWLGDDEQG